VFPLVQQMAILCKTEITNASNVTTRVRLVLARPVQNVKPASLFSISLKTVIKLVCRPALGISPKSIASVMSVVRLVSPVQEPRLMSASLVRVVRLI
jgi:hypothetical protein